MAETTEQYRNRINQIANSVGNELYLKDMRDNIAEGISKTGNRQADIEVRQDALEDDFVAVQQDASSASPSGAEMVVARAGFNTLDERLTVKEQEVAAQLAQIENEKASINYVDAILMDIAKGGPKGPFNSISALKTTYPTGAEGTWLVFDSSFTDGAHSFIWDTFNSSWKDLGAYQPAVIADETITLKKLAFKPVLGKIGKNLFNKNTVIKDKFIAAYNGEVMTPLDGGTNYNAGDWIELEPNTDYTMNVTHQTAFYGVNKNRLSGITTVGLNPYTFNTGTSIKWTRPTVLDEHLDTFQIEKGTTFTGYEKFNYYLPLENMEPELQKKINNIPANDPSDETVNFIGDSGVFGYESGTGNRVAKPYPTIVKELFGYKKVNNYGISGSTIAGDSSQGIGYRPIVERYTEMEYADYIGVDAGTNDKYAANIPLGEPGDTVNTTFYGGLNNLTTGLIKQFPSSIIFFITPLPRSNETEQVNLKERVDAIKEVCAKHSIPVLDLYNNSGFHVHVPEWKDIYAPDGLHGTGPWYRIKGRKVGNFLATL